MFSMCLCCRVGVTLGWFVVLTFGCYSVFFLCVLRCVLVFSFLFIVLFLLSYLRLVFAFSSLFITCFSSFPFFPLFCLILDVLFLFYFKFVLFWY